MPSITDLAKIVAFNAIINYLKYLILLTQLLLLLLPSVSNLVKKTDYNTNINEIEKNISDHDHDKKFTTPEFNELRAENLLQDQHK